MSVRVKESTATRERVGSVRHLAGCRMEARVRDFAPIGLDEPPVAGGTDTGPTPLELVTTGLAGCKAVTVAKIADAMGFRFENLDVRAVTDVKYRASTTGAGPIPRFSAARVAISFDTTESAERCRELAAMVSERCPASNLFADAGIEVAIEWPWERA